MKSSRAAAMARRRSLSMGTTCISATTSSHWSRPRSNAEEDSPVKDRISITMLDGGIADVRLIRTDKMNAPDPAMREALAEAVDQDRKSVVQGKSVSERVDLGGRRIIKKK